MHNDDKTQEQMYIKALYRFDGIIVYMVMYNGLNNLTHI